MPLTVGNEWNYRTISTIDFVDTLITDMADTTTYASEITAEDTLNDGTDVFEQVTTWDDTLLGVDTSYVLDNGDYVLGYSDKADAVPDTIIAYPLEVGKTWNLDADIDVVVIAEGEDVTVGAGTFSCWKLGQIDASDDTVFVYVAEGTGTVKVSFGESDTTMTMTSSIELQSTNVE